MSKIGWILGGLAAVGLGLAVFDGKTANAAPALPPSPSPTPPPPPSPTPGTPATPGAKAPSIPASYLPAGWKPGDPIPPEIQQIANALNQAAAEIKPPATKAERRRIAATELEEELLRTKPGAEDKGFVKVYQASTDGALKVDGAYGPKSALSLAKDLGHTPPEPRVWPKGIPIATSRRQYLRDLAQIVTVAK